MRHWRTESHAKVPTARERKELRADKSANKVSVALGRQPGLFPQARGQLHWEESAKLNRRTTFRSDRPLKGLLQKYIDEQKDELEAETAQRHSRALNGPAHRMTFRPLSKAEWVRWLDKGQATYENALRLVKVGVRWAVNATAGCPAEGSSDPPKATY